MAQKDRGFAAMGRAKQREIASLGGKAAQKKGTAHTWTQEEAKAAGRKGGITRAANRRAAKTPQVQMTDVPMFRGPDYTVERG